MSISLYLSLGACSAIIMLGLGSLALPNLSPRGIHVCIILSAVAWPLFSIVYMVISIEVILMYLIRFLVKSVQYVIGGIKDIFKEITG